MNKNDLSRLLERYLSARQSDKEPYFDADEIEMLLNNFEETNDFTYYEEVLNLGMKLHPGNSELQIKHCRQLVFNEDYLTALEKIEGLSNGDRLEVDLMRLECYCAIEQFDSIIEIIEEKERNNDEGLLLIFEYIIPILNDLEYFSEAKDLVNRGLKLFPDSQILKDELCYIYENTGENEAAIRLYNELIDKNPYSYDYWFSLGRLYSMIGEYDKAIEAFDFAVTCDESKNDLRILKAYCLYMNESYSKAIEIYEELKDNVIIWDQVKSLVAECYIRMENFEKAYELLNSIKEREDIITEGAFFVKFANCCFETNREAEAIAALYLGLKIFPNQPNILSMLELFYANKGDVEKKNEIKSQLDHALELEEQYERLREELGDNEDVIYNLANIEAEMDQYKEMEREHPDAPILTVFYAVAYFIKGDMDMFKKYFGKLEEQGIKTFKRLVIEAIVANEKEEEEDAHLTDQIKMLPPKNLINDFLKNKENNN